MWMLWWVPDSFLTWAIHAILIGGAVGTFLSFFLLHRIVRWFPALAPWHLLIQIVSVALLVGGVYFKGGYDTEASWRAKVAEAEAKIAAAEVKSKETNVVIKKVYVDRVKKVKELQIVYKDRIKEVEKVIDAECKVAPEAISILNDSAKLRKGTVTISPVEPVKGDKK